jgi:hypothetical protein
MIKLSFLIHTTFAYLIRSYSVKKFRIKAEFNPQQQFLKKETVEEDGEEFLNFEQIENKIKIGSSLANSPVLVLNANYQPLSYSPLSLWSWQCAVRAVFNEKAVVISEYNLVIRSVSMALNLPSVIALKSFFKKPDGVPLMTKQRVFIRDGFRCQVFIFYFILFLFIYLLA